MEYLINLLKLIILICQNPILLYLFICIFCFMGDDPYMNHEYLMNRILIISSETNLNKSDSYFLLRKIKKVAFKEYLTFQYLTFKGIICILISISIGIALRFFLGKFPCNCGLLLMSVLVPCIWEFKYDSKHYYYTYYDSNLVLLGLINIVVNYVIIEIILKVF